MRRGLIAAAVAVLAFAVAVTAAVAKTEESVTAAQVAACTNVTLGVNAPLTGPAGFLGQEQLSWARFAVSKYNRASRTRFKITQGDSQLDAAKARTVTQRFVSDANVMASIGPSISQGVITSRALLQRARMLAISPSATRVDLTLPKRKVSQFFRNVPHDGIQSPTVANYIKRNLKASDVVVVDSQDDYSVPLADAIQRLLRRQNVDVSRESVAATDTDFSSVVTNVGNDVDVVVFATQTASQAHTMSQQLREQGKRAVVFGTDGVYSPTQYKPRNGYVSIFAADLHFLKSARGIVREYNRFSKNKSFGAFGPPTYMASWIAMNAIVRACNDGRVSRGELTPIVQRSTTPSILGGNIRFNGKGDVIGARFELYKVTNGKYSQLGVSFFLQNTVLLLYGAEFRSYDTDFLVDVDVGIDSGPLTVWVIRIVVVASALAMMGGLWLLVTRTQFGKAMRATAFDREAAAMMGIDVDRVIVKTFFIGSALAGAAGVLIGLVFFQINHFMGFNYGLKGFTAAVVGGIGSIPGAMVGGLLIGLIESLSVGYIQDFTGGRLNSSFRDLVVFSILVVFMLFRPQGLFGKPEVKKV